MQLVHVFSVLVASSTAAFFLQGCSGSAASSRPTPDAEKRTHLVEDVPTKDAEDCTKKGMIAVYMVGEYIPESVSNIAAAQGYVVIAKEGEEFKGKKGKVRVIHDQDGKKITNFHKISRGRVDLAGSRLENNALYTYDVQIDGVSELKTFSREEVCAQVLRDPLNHEPSKYAQPSSADASGSKPPKGSSTLEAHSATLAGVHKHRMSITKPNEVTSSHSRSIDEDITVIVQH